MRFCKGLSTEIFIAGGAKKPVILNITIGVMCVMNSSSLLLTLVIMVFFLITHTLILFASKKDPKFFEVFVNYLKSKENYDS